MYILKKQILKYPQEGCGTPPNVLKLGISGVKNTAKTNKN